MLLNHINHTTQAAINVYCNILVIIAPLSGIFSKAVTIFSTMSGIPASAAAAVLVQSEPLPEDAIPIRGPDLTKPLSLTELLSSYQKIGFQASSLSTAVNIIQNMVCLTYISLDEVGFRLIDQRRWRLSDVPITPDEPDDLLDPQIRASTKCTIFLGFTSNLMSSGLREIFRFLVQHNHISAIVTTAGGIEEDFIKCLGKTYLADFNLDGASLRKKGLNRIGNLVVPNDNYCAFEDWVIPILDQMLEEQKTQGTVWCPSTVIHRLGKEINNEESVYYWAYKVLSHTSFLGFCSFDRRTISPSSAQPSQTAHSET